MIKFEYNDSELKCSMENSHYSHGVGINCIFYDDSVPVGQMLLLCDRTRAEYPTIEKYTIPELITLIEKALKSNQLDESLNVMFQWESEKNKIGHQKISPIIIPLSKLLGD